MANMVNMAKVVDANTTYRADVGYVGNKIARVRKVHKSQEEERFFLRKKKFGKVHGIVFEETRERGALVKDGHDEEPRI